MKIECIRGGAVRLLLALILGLLVVSGYVVAPILFAKAGSAHEAGRLAGEIFHTVNIALLIMAAAVGSFWIRMRSISRLNWGALVALLLLVAVNEFAVSPILAELKAAAGAIDKLPADDPQRTAFGMWHGVSAVIHLLASGAAALLVALGGLGRNHGSCNES